MSQINEKIKTGAWKEFQPFIQNFKVLARVSQISAGKTWKDIK